MLPLIAMGVMSVIGAMGSIGQGKAEKQIADANAKQAEANAAQARYAAREEAAMIRRKSAYTVGSMKATAGGTGIYVDSGSFTDKIADTESQYELDAIKALYNGELQATAFTSQANLYRYSGKVAQKQSYFQAGFGLAKNAFSMYNHASAGGVVQPTDNIPSVLSTANGAAYAVPKGYYGTDPFVSNPFK